MSAAGVSLKVARRYPSTEHFENFGSDQAANSKCININTSGLFYINFLDFWKMLKRAFLSL